jgi:hypothetical protein
MKMKKNGIVRRRKEFPLNLIERKYIVNIDYNNVVVSSNSSNVRFVKHKRIK